VIHGEYYPRNILGRGGRVHPVDWESAAIGAAEIDIAALTEHWPRDVTATCLAAYLDARWPRGAPEGFAERLALARMYLHFRWLGEQPARAPWRWSNLRALARRMGLLTRQSAGRG
jgi:thiamine kinase-like enzyme